MKITLTPLEEDMAAVWAAKRLVESAARSLQAHDTVRSFEIDLIGAQAELVVAKYLGVYPEFSLNTWKAPDVAGLQVRGTTHPKGRLIIRERDKDSDVYIHVKKVADGYEVIGLVTGAKAKKVGLKEAPNGRLPCWFVPDEKLNKLELLQGKRQAAI